MCNLTPYGAFLEIQAVDELIYQSLHWLRFLRKPLNIAALSTHNSGCC